MTEAWLSSSLHLSGQTQNSCQGMKYILVLKLFDNTLLLNNLLTSTFNLHPVFIWYVK